MKFFSKTALTLLISSFLVTLSADKSAAQPLGLMSQKPQPEPEICVLSTSGGRYVFGQVSDSGNDKFMLDTRTGRLWKISEKGTVGQYLKEIPYLIKKGKYSPLPDKIPDTGSDKRKDQ